MLERMATASKPLVKIRKIIAALPETEERESHGAPTFWGGKKTFASYHENHHGDGRYALWCKATLEVQEVLVEHDPHVFFVPPYVGSSGWVGVCVDKVSDWSQVERLLEDGYRMVAPKRALRTLDGV